MLKKIFYWTTSMLQVLFIIAAYVIQYFSMKRMGMMRYVVFKNHEWEAQYPVAALKYSAIAFLTILCAAAVIYIRTKISDHKMGKKALIMIMTDIVITLIFVLFILIFSAESYRSYYFTSLILAIVVLIQHIKMFLVSFKH